MNLSHVLSPTLGLTRNRVSHVGHRLLALLPLFVGASNLRCGPPEPCHPDHLGKTLIVTLVKRIESTCASAQPEDLVGQSFTVRLDGTIRPDTASCRCGTGTIVSSPEVANWSNPRAPSGGCSGDLFNAVVDVTRDDCSTTASIAIYGDVTTSSDPENTGAALDYGDAKCSCGGRFRVAVREVPGNQ